MSKPTILVTGANGQLGSALKGLADAHPEFDFIFVSRAEMPIDEPETVQHFFQTHRPAYCINTAAYTAVDKAETEKVQAFRINGEAVGLLAAVCAAFGTKFIHISTDYVFDGSSPEPYKEESPVNPVNTYGLSKLKGEALCLYHNPDAIIIRTAWVYAESGNNFVKTMLRLMKERPAINVVNDQVGAPTYAVDLAAAILTIISRSQLASHPGIYHYSNKGRISWYDFAVAIKELTGSACVVHPIPSSQYPTPAKRPSFSLLNTQKIQDTFGLTIPDWKDSLQQCLHRLSI